MKTRTSKVWKFVIALLPAAGIVVAQTRMDDDWFSSRAINTAGLVHYWNFEGSGGNLAGSVTLTSTNFLTYSSGLYGFMSASCGSQRWYTTSSDIVLSTNYTVSFWANRLYGPHISQNQFGMPFGGLSTAQGYYYFQTNLIRVYNDGETKSLQLPYACPSNSWNHYVFVCSPTSVAAYVNGGLLGQSNNTPPFTITVQSIGRAYVTVADGGDRFVWRGLLDDFRIYNRALSSGEVFNIYSEASP